MNHDRAVFLIVRVQPHIVWKVEFYFGGVSILKLILLKFYLLVLILLDLIDPLEIGLEFNFLLQTHLDNDGVVVVYEESLQEIQNLPKQLRMEMLRVLYLIID